MGTKENTYHLPALLIVLSSAPQRAAHRAADLRMLWVVNSFSKRALDILKKMRLTLKQFEACEFNYLYLIPVCYGCLQIHPTQAASGG